MIVYTGTGEGLRQLQPRGQHSLGQTQTNYLYTQLILTITYLFSELIQ